MCSLGCPHRTLQGHRVWGLFGGAVVWERGAAQTLLKTTAPLVRACNGRARLFAKLFAEITLPAL